MLNQIVTPAPSLHAEPGRLVVRAARGARAGWSEAAKAMRARGKDRLLDEASTTRFEEKDW